MNLQQYANYYGNFHGATEIDVIENCIVYKLEKVSWSKSIVLKLKNFQKAYDDNNINNIRPISKSLMKHFKLETPYTVFITDDSFSVLYGNTCLVYPKSNGSIFVVATQYFVLENITFKKIMTKYNAECVSENTYFYKSIVVFLDAFDIPFPGGSYFSDRNNKNALSRICFILDQQDASKINELVRNLENVDNIYHKPLQTKYVNASISKFIDPIPVNETEIPTSQYEYTNIIIKRLCYKNPNFIIQDILNSCNITTEIGIVIEYPICITFTSTYQLNSPKRYFCFAINSHKPSKFLHVPYPYDRYYQYNQGLNYINWVTLYYDHLSNDKTIDILDVRIDSNIVGHVYKDTFFCLSHPKILKFISSSSMNTKYILNKLSFNIEDDKNMTLLSINRFNSDFIIYCVKHKDIPYDMFCLEKFTPNINNYKTDQLPHLVQNWATFVKNNENQTNLKVNDLNFIKLMYILSRHKICFSMRESQSRNIEFVKKKDIIIEVEKKAIDFINNMKLDFMRKNIAKNNEDDSCVLS